MPSAPRSGAVARTPLLRVADARRLALALTTPIALVTLSACAGASAQAGAPGAPPPPAAPLEHAITTADSIVAAGVGTRYAGAVLLVAHDGRVLHERAFGSAQLYDYDGRPVASPPPMRVTTQFDLASVTKVMATTFAVMMLVDRGKVDLDAPVYRYLPDFRGPHRDSITVRHLLSHSAGLVQWQPLYYHASTPEETYRVIRDMPLEWGVGEARHYSDLGFMLLGYIVERVSGERLDAFLAHELYGPLGLRATCFLPKRHGFSEFAATERGNGYERRMVYDSTFGYRYLGDPTAWDGWRRYVLDGEVDDGNAWYANGGVAGHAGLFSTAADLHVLLELLLHRGEYGGHRYISARVVDEFLTRDRYDNYLGWKLPSALPPGSFAHDGFTGTYVLGVPARHLAVVLLTNRQNVGTDERGYFANLGGVEEAVGRVLVAAVP